MSLYSCFALIEHETAILYEAMVAKAEDHNAALLLNVILQETKGHEEIFKHLAVLSKQSYPPGIPDCKRLMGSIFVDSLEFTRNLSGSLQKGIGSLEAMRGLVRHEASVSEEYVTMIHSRVNASEEENATVKKILEYIAADEERHVEILKRAIALSSTKMKH